MRRREGGWNKEEWKTKAQERAPKTGGERVTIKWMLGRGHNGIANTVSSEDPATTFSIKDSEIPLGTVNSQVPPGLGKRHGRPAVCTMFGTFRRDRQPTQLMAEPQHHLAGRCWLTYGSPTWGQNGKSSLACIKHCHDCYKCYYIRVIFGFQKDTVANDKLGSKYIVYNNNITICYQGGFWAKIRNTWNRAKKFIEACIETSVFTPNYTIKKNPSKKSSSTLPQVNFNLKTRAETKNPDARRTEPQQGHHMGGLNGLIYHTPP